MREKVGGRYTLIQPHPFDEGGFAKVYLARNDGLNRKVVIKRIVSNYKQDIDTLRAEAELVGTAFNHPNIVKIEDVFVDQIDDSWRCDVVMEHIEGGPLYDLIHDPQIRFSVECAAFVIYSVALALEQIRDFVWRGERFQLVHGDVNPNNIMVSFGGEVKLIDFGVSRLRRQGDRPVIVERIEHGVPSYMAPERFERDPETGEKMIDHRADIWALGAIWFELHTRTPLFIADSNEATIAKILDGRMRQVRDVFPKFDRDISRYIARLYEANKEVRLQSAKEIVRDLPKLVRDLLLGREQLKAHARTAWERKLTLSSPYLVEKDIIRIQSSPAAEALTPPKARRTPVLDPAMMRLTSVGTPPSEEERAVLLALVTPVSEEVTLKNPSGEWPGLVPPPPAPVSRAMAPPENAQPKMAAGVVTTPPEMEGVVPTLLDVDADAPSVIISGENTAPVLQPLSSSSARGLALTSPSSSSLERPEPRTRSAAPREVNRRSTLIIGRPKSMHSGDTHRGVRVIIPAALSLVLLGSATAVVVSHRSAPRAAPSEPAATTGGGAAAPAVGAGVEAATVGASTPIHAEPSTPMRPATAAFTSVAVAAPPSARPTRGTQHSAKRRMSTGTAPTATALPVGYVDVGEMPSASGRSLKVLIDGVGVGSPPLTVETTAGEHRVVVVDSVTEAVMQKQRITVDPGKTRKLRFQR